MIRICASAAVIPLVYLTGAFIAWDFNAENWDSFGRAMCAVNALWVSGMVAFLPEWRK